MSNNPRQILYSFEVDNEVINTDESCKQTVKTSASFDYNVSPNWYLFSIDKTVQHAFISCTI